MNELLLSPEISLSIFLSTLVLFFLTIALYYSVVILLQYDKNATSALQYDLEKKSFLLSTLIKVALFISIFLFALFAFSIDHAAELIPGAMCGAGVVGSGTYGTYLIALKFVIIVLAMLWIAVDNEDQKGCRYPYFKQKLYFYLFLYFLMLSSWFLELNFFMSLSIEEPVLCCSNIYKSSTESFLFGMNIKEVVVLFYITFFGIVLSTYFQKKIFLALLSGLFLYLSYISIVYFFSTYIYELPTHKCPYCILSGDYYFIGYFIYSALIIANYYSLYGIVFSFKNHAREKIVVSYIIFVLLVSLKYIYYYLINSVLL